MMPSPSTSRRLSTSTNNHINDLSTTETFVDSPWPAARPNGPSPIVINGVPPLAEGIPRTTRPQSQYGYNRPPNRRRESTIDPDSTPSIIPPRHDNRTLVLCFDGTGDQFDADNSNIVQLAGLLKKDDRREQMVYYQAGIGTYISPKVASPMMSRVAKSLDTMLAWHLDAHVMDGYEFLMQNYQSGDRICLFGFSRGAYTARSLAGMLQKVGLLPPDNWQQVPFAYKMYTRTDAIGWEQSTDFKRAFCVDVQINFVGVWDTVDSVGIIPRRLPFTTSNTIVRTFRHAVSLDERRAKFKANLWNRPTQEEQKLGTPKPSPSTSRKSTRNFSTLRVNNEHRRLEKLSFEVEYDPEDERFMREMEGLHSEMGTKPTDVEEVWFAGCHCDVGGGSVSNDTRYSLARISLRWMVRECFKANTGIMFDADRLRDIGLDPSTLYPYVTPRVPPLPTHGLTIQSPLPDFKQPIGKRVMKKLRRTGSQIFMLQAVSRTLQREDVDPFMSEEDEERADALSPKYDQLKHAKLWWLLELIPMEFRHQVSDGKWVSWFGLNLARPRHVPKVDNGVVKVHRSVRLRMDACRVGKKKDHPYRPKAHVSLDNVAWID